MENQNHKLYQDILIDSIGIAKDMNILTPRRYFTTTSISLAKKAVKSKSKSSGNKTSALLGRTSSKLSVS